MPVLGVRAFGIDLSCIEEGVEVLAWLDFLHHAYSLSSPLGSEHANWASAWKARQRVLNRFRTRDFDAVHDV